jgi:hypothetical protein
MRRLAVYIIHDRAIDEEVNDVLKDADIEYFTKWRDVVGTGSHDPHLGDHVWPGLNNVTLAIVESGKKDDLINRIKALQEIFPSVGLRAFVTHVVDMV